MRSRRFTVLRARGVWRVCGDGSRVIAGLLWLFEGGLAEHLGGITDDYIAEGRGDFKDMMGRIFGATALFSWSSYRSYKKAELEKSTSIQSSDRIESVVMAILKRSRKIFSPQLVVVRVAHEIWKDVVSRLAAASDVVLIDVSKIGEGLLWEIENLRTQHAHQWILVGQHDALMQLSTRAVGNAADGSVEQRLAALLDGSKALAYTGDKPRQMKRFARLLRANLDNI